MVNKPHDTRQGGVHIDYIINLLETCKAGKHQSLIILLCHMRFKTTVLKMIRWATQNRLLNREPRGAKVYYTTTMKGRVFQDTLARYDKA